MMATEVIEEAVYRSGDVHPFLAAETPFLYLVESGGIVDLTPPAAAAFALIRDRAATREDIVAALAGKGYAPDEVREALDELDQFGAILDRAPVPAMLQEPAENFPLQTMVLNLTNQCNLSCGYCYEFGEDKVATPEGKPKFMSWEIARSAVDRLFIDSAGRQSIHVTFFGGETLMNFPLLERVVAYANEKAGAEGRSIDYSLTTNGTLLSSRIIQFLADNNVGVTVSIDGPKEMNDKLRVFANGKGSYEIIAPKVKELLATHKTRPIAARVTLTAQVRDVVAIFRHLRDEMGFHEVGFAPVTTSPQRLYAIEPSGLDQVLEQFRQLAYEYRDCALRNELHGFSNVSDTLNELHQGINKSHPCGAGLGLVGVGPSGDISPCHRFVDSDTHKLGHVDTGIDRAVQKDFLKRGHIQSKYDCHTCWARPLCAGGCHHEAFVRYGDTGHPNLHYCDWIRGWTDLCLEIYGEIAVRNPAFLSHFDRRKSV
jgi:uncharacterized protein